MVLVVEDDPSVRRMLGRHLKLAGISADYVPTVATAEARFTGGNIRCLVLDHCLPDGTGVELLRRLRADPGGEDLRVAFFSASASADEQDEARSLGAVCFDKPDGVEELIRFIRDACGRG